MSAKDDRRQHGELSLAARILPNGPKPRPWHSSSFAMEGWWTFMTLASAQLKTRDDQGKRRRNREGLLSHSLRAVWESIQPSLRFLPKVRLRATSTRPHDRDSGLSRIPVE